MANTTTTTVIWKSVKGFEQYEVSNTGLVKSLKGKNPRIMKPRRKKFFKKDGSVELGYEELILNNKGVQYSKLVHRLVAMAFIENHDNKPEVNHIDEDKGNNSVENLEWGTRVERSAKAQSQAILSIDEFGTVEKMEKRKRQSQRYGFM